LHVVVHKGIPDSKDLQSAWQTLVQTVDRPQIFYTYEWARSVARAYEGSLDPLLITAFDEGELVGVAALAANYSDRQASFLAGTTADYCDFICIEHYRKQFVDQVLEKIEDLGVETLVLANLPADSPTAWILREIGRRRGFSILSRPAYHCAQVIFRSGGERAAVKNAASQKQVVRRHLKALGKLGQVRIEHLTGEAEVTQALPEFARMHVSRFLSTGKLSSLASNERREFLRELTREFSGTGQVVLSRLTFQGYPIAYHFGFRFGDAWFWYQPTFDTEFQQYSPGLCLLAKIIEAAAEDPALQMVDLGLGAEDYKGRWSSQGRDTLHVIASRSSLTYCREAVRYHVGRTIQRNPRLLRAVRRGFAATLAMKRRNQSPWEIAISLGEKISDRVMNGPEIIFFEKPESDAVVSEMRILPATMNLFASAAMHYAEDSETLNYLVRASARVGCSSYRGLVLVDDNELPVHFCWVTPFEKFYLSELKREVSAPEPNSTLIFDCWTPGSKRGKGHYASTISQIAADIHRSGSRAWIFAAATRLSSLRGIRKAGFVERFSVVLRRSGLRRTAIYSDISPTLGAMTQASSAA